MTMDQLLFALGFSMETAQPLLWRAPEAARALSISESTLWKLVKAGQLPVVRLGRSVRFAPASLQAWIAGQTSQPAAPAPAEKEIRSPNGQLSCA
jgi:excisionase family DNA binding protein